MYPCQHMAPRRVSDRPSVAGASEKSMRASAVAIRLPLARGLRSECEAKQAPWFVFSATSVRAAGSRYPTNPVPSITAITLHRIARAAGTLSPPDSVYSDRIPVAVLIDAWERAIATTSRRDLPGLAAIYDGPDERSWISFVVANQPRFTDAIDKFQRYAPTISDAFAGRSSRVPTRFA